MKILFALKPEFAFMGIPQNKIPSPENGIARGFLSTF